MSAKAKKLPPLPPSVEAETLRRESEAYERRLRSGHFFLPPGGLSISVGPGLGGNASRNAAAIEDIPYPHPVGVNGGSGRVRPQRGV